MAFVPCGAAAVCNPVGLPLCVSHWAHSAHWHRAGWMAARPQLLSSCPSQQLPPRCPISGSPAALSFFPFFFFFFPEWNPFCAQAFLQAGSQGWHRAGSTQRLPRLILPSVSSWQWSPSDPAGPLQSQGSSWSCQGAPSFRYGPMVAAAQGDQG